ncbi:MAG: tetraacyldisaccharide 4'-kinase [Candidatus Brocadiaceae bacterium]|nr:tetraacyldisaccharide 4'-kinase [Candidatus Brocadiaceae bacterium]
MREEQADVFSVTIRFALLFLSKIYGFFIKTRIFFYRVGILKTKHLPIIVISVGNITVGGTGKTPVTQFISQYIQNKGKKVAIISRGYRAKIRQSNGTDVSESCNDEYLLFKENVPDIPHLMNSDRIKSGREAINLFQAEYLLLDDGFQHLRIDRDLDIVLIDALNPFGYEQIIPRGLLREPLIELKRAHMIMLTHVDQCRREKIDSIRERLHKIVHGIPIIETVHKPICLEFFTDSKRLDYHWLKGKRIYAFCAIGNPVSFKKSIENLGGIILNFRIFPDHHVYTRSELRALHSEAQRFKPDAILITQKDKVKIRNNISAWKVPLLTLKMEIRIVRGYTFFEKKIDALLN